jgi:amino acid adenylation domain
MYAEKHASDSYDDNIERMAQSSGNTEPDLAITTFPLNRDIDAPETASILAQCKQWNTTSQTYDLSRCIPQLVETCVQRTPDAPAIVQRKRIYTYARLNAQANQLARYLRARGVGPNVLVCVCMERSLEMIVCLLAILKAGGAYVPLDPAHPVERLTFMLNDTQAPIVLTTTALAQQLSDIDGSIVCLDGAERDWLHESSENLSPLTNASDLAYVIYTSGSTGRPKGAEVTHGNLLNLIFWHQDYFMITEYDRASQFASLSFDITVEEIWPYLTCGASVHLLPDENTRIMPELLRDWMVQQHITISMLPTAVAENLLTLTWPPETALRFILTGGDTLYRQPAANLPFTLINNYGLTETTVVATCEPIAPEGTGSHPLPIGRPIANTQIFLLDAQRQPVPAGECGEIYVGGACIARGYLNRPELTKERFIQHPFSNQPGARLYKTGDMARYLDDGRLVFLGRADYQVKIRGHRIELGEIEQVMRTHPAIHDAVVLAHEHLQGEKRLAAYAVPRKGEQLTETEVRTFISERVPHYMVPAAFVLMESFPLNINGKVDRKALPQPQASRATKTTTIIKPADLTPLQAQLLQSWEETLDSAPLGLHDNFFALGGHSLLAAHLLKRIEQSCGYKVSYATLFAGPTIAQLATAMQQQQEIENHTMIHAIQEAQPGGAQQPFFFLHGDWTGGAFYCYTMSRVCGREQPFYALEPYTFKSEEPIPSITTIAAAHIAALRNVQPTGPYMLGGFCNGGLVAYEMAQQLYAAGEQVDLLLLVTPSTADTLPMLRPLVRKWSWLFGSHRQQQIQSYLRLRHALRHLYRSIRPYDKHVRDFNKLVALDSRLKQMFPPMAALLHDYVGVFSWLAAEYDIRRPSVYPGQTTFIWASGEPAIQRAWQVVTSYKDPHTLEEYHLPGNHMSCVTEQIAELAKIIDIRLRQTQKTQQLL